MLGRRILSRCCNRLDEASRALLVAGALNSFFSKIFYNLPEASVADDGADTASMGNKLLDELWIIVVLISFSDLLLLIRLRAKCNFQAPRGHPPIRLTEAARPLPGKSSGSHGRP